MIVSVSRRTDIPAFYSDWFFQRLREGYALVRNPMNPHQVSRIRLDRECADAFVFWSKNPAPLLAHLDELDSRPYYIHFTLTPYGSDIESGLPDKNTLLTTFARLCDLLGPDRVIWRYDPIFLTPSYDMAFHKRAFAAMARRLAPYTHRVTVSFLDDYRHIRKAMRDVHIQPLPMETQLSLLGFLAPCAQSLGLQMDTCCESVDFSALGVGKARCIDAQLLSRIAGIPCIPPRDPNQRVHCGCAASVDIGAYDTCHHGCRYCYATHGTRAAARYDVRSPLLLSTLDPQDAVRERAMPPAFDRQLCFAR